MPPKRARVMIGLLLASGSFAQVESLDFGQTSPAVADHHGQARFRVLALEAGSLQVLSYFGGEFERRPDGSIRGFERNDGIVEGETNQYYRNFVAATRGIDYQGYLSYELCHQLPVVNGETVGIEFADHNARLAALFMRNLLEE